MRKSPKSISNFRDETIKRLTDEVVGMLDQVDEKNWTLPWNSGNVRALQPLNPLSGSRYHGINWLVLATLAGATGRHRDEESSFTSARFATYKQWTAAGCQVRAGSTGIPLVYFKQFAAKETGPNEVQTEEKGKGGAMLKAFTVFAAEQVDGAEKYLPDTTVVAENGFDTCRFLTDLGVVVEYGSDRAAALGDGSYIMMPLSESFVSREAYIATLFHEVTHWSKKHVGRDDYLVKNFTDLKERYAFEELVAELGSTMLSGVFGIRSSAQPGNVQYLKSWLGALRNDRSYLLKAASKAQQAVDWILSKVGDPNAVADADAVAEEQEAEALV